MARKSGSTRRAIPGWKRCSCRCAAVASRPFLGRGHSTPSWSPDNSRLAYIGSSEAGDPLSLADRTGADARPIDVRPPGTDAFVRKGVHTHNPVWSADGQWIYFTHGADPNGRWMCGVCGRQATSAEQLTHQHAPVNYLAPIDLRPCSTSRAREDWSGPWLWALDVPSTVTRRATTGLEKYTSVSASRDGRRVVATMANPTASLWSVPLLDRVDRRSRGAALHVPSDRALAPRFGGGDAVLSVAVVGGHRRRALAGPGREGVRSAQGRRRRSVRAARRLAGRQSGRRRRAAAGETAPRHHVGGRDERADAGDRHRTPGSAGQGTADWSPDGTWLVAGGSNGQGPGLFKIPVDGGDPERLVGGEARNPVWSPKGDLIVYAVPFAGVGGRDALRAVRPDGAPVAMPDVRVRLGGAHRFLRNGTGLVYLPALETKDFWLLDLASRTSPSADALQQSRLSETLRRHTRRAAPGLRPLVAELRRRVDRSARSGRSLTRGS